MISNTLNDGRKIYHSYIRTSADVELLRHIRNECRGGFSHDTSEITKEQQAQWWENYKGRRLGYLYWIPTSIYGRQVIGYGLLREDDLGRPCSSVAVLPAHAGNGYGGYITAHLIRRSPETVYASARKDNPAACALHRAEDWEITDQDDTLIYYKTKEDIWSRQQRELRNDTNEDNRPLDGH